MSTNLKRIIVKVKNVIPVKDSYKQAKINKMLIYKTVKRGGK
jgi:hypothetical protein